MAFFEVTHNDSSTRARTGILHTDHGDIPTPIFMPVGTQATVKSLDSEDIKKTKADIILANTYHLHLRPGEDLISKFGGVHKFMQWDKPILTDSGGFQVFSLGAQKEKRQRSLPVEDTNNTVPKRKEVELTKIDEEGVTFTSHLDGSKHRFTPEIAIDIQHKLGADIIMAFDECTPDDADITYATRAMERTHRWAKRCIDAHEQNKTYHGYRQFLFGIIQGGNHRDLREASAKAITSLPFDGIAIGGESIGYNMDATRNILTYLHPLLPEDKPRYTMGLGFSPRDLFDVVERGIDMFDCVSPTRMARNGALFISPLSGGNEKNKYRFNVSNGEFKEDAGPIDPTCTCTTCQTYSRAYLHHLFRAEELLAYRLASIHNVYFFVSLMSEIREAIKNGTFTSLKNTWCP
jgi:tRNA-guanine transglycosylase